MLPRLFNYLLRRLHDEGDAEDAAQESFVRVFQHREKHDPRHRFATWLYTIATNLARTRQRQRARHSEISLETENDSGAGTLQEQLAAPGPGPNQQMETAERGETVRQAVAQLPEELRDPPIMAEYEELPHQEIGQILGCSAKAVEMRVYRARQQLRQLLIKWLGLISPAGRKRHPLRNYDKLSACQGKKMKIKSMPFSFLPHEDAAIPARQKNPATTWIIVLVPIALAVAMGIVLWRPSQDQSGPNDGEIVAWDAGQTSCEILANGETGDVRVYTWSKNLKSIQPVANWPLKLGSADQTLELVPQPDVNDLPGYCSKFYGQADWLRGGQPLQGWISSAGDGTRRRNFEWKHGWQAGIHLQPICCGVNCQRP